MYGSNGFDFIRKEITQTRLSKEQYDHLCQTKFLHGKPYALHEIAFVTDLPKRFELGDADENNPYHLFFYMLARLYYIDDEINPVKFYYPNKKNLYLSEQALKYLPSRFQRLTEREEGLEYVELPGCEWSYWGINEYWVYDYVRNLFQEIWNSIPMIKGKYTYVSRNKNSRRVRDIENEQEYLKKLKEMDVSVYTMESLTFVEQIRLFRQSELITGPHGASYAFMIFCHPQTHFFEINPDTSYYACYIDIARRQGNPYKHFSHFKKIEKESGMLTIESEMYLEELQQIIDRCKKS